MRLLRFLGRQQGSSIALLVVALPFLMGILGIVVDAGLFGLTLVRLNSAADSAALAAASAVDMDYYQETGVVRLNPSVAQARAEAFAKANFDNPVRITVTFPNPPGRVHVRLDSEVQTVFLKILGVDKAPVDATSEAQAG